MSLYSRYSESSISVSYFSRSSALICSDVLLPELLPHLSSLVITALARRVRFAFGHRPGAHAVHGVSRHPADIDERVTVLRAGAELGQCTAVRWGAVALVFREAVAGVLVFHGDHQSVPADFRQHTGRRDAGGRRITADHRQ